MIKEKYKIGITAGLLSIACLLLYVANVNDYVRALMFIVIVLVVAVLSEHIVKVEKALRENKGKLKAMLQSLSDHMSMMDEGLNILWANETTKKIFGEDIIGKKCYEVYHKRKEPCEPSPCLTLKAFEDGKVHELDTQMTAINGEIKYFHCTANVALTDKDGKPTAVIEILHDITDRKRAEKELKQVNEQLKASVERSNLLAEREEAANQAKNQFLANMSHEIRTPMNAIIGFSEVLAEKKLTDEQRHHVNIIRESAESLLSLINDILDFSKIEAGILDIEIVDYSLEQLFAVVDSLMRARAKEKGLRFEILQCGKFPAQIRTDPLRLRQCLMNLIKNAIKFTEEGHVYVNIFMQEFNNKPYIRFNVEDTGIGIAPDKQESIFEEFTQMDASIACRHSGTGLGLTVTKRLAQLLGGELTLTSEVGKGSVFSLIIPANVDLKLERSFSKYDHINQLKEEPDIPGQDKFVGHVLVAEDSETNQMLIKVLLERLGLQVTIAEDGKQGVDKALSQPFNLIFMDMQMPNMNGYEATRILRERGLKTAIVALTAYAMQGDDDKCIAAGCSDYVAKPIDRKMLLQVIRKYLPVKGETLDDKTDVEKFVGEKEVDIVS